jgi:hypothetical protein
MDVDPVLKLHIKKINMFIFMSRAGIEPASSVLVRIDTYLIATFISQFKRMVGATSIHLRAGRPTNSSNEELITPHL